MVTDSQEFRRYRQILGGLYLAVASLGAVLLIASILVELFFRRGGPAPGPTPADLLACNEEVRRLLEDLGEAAADLQRDAARGAPKTELGDRWAEFSRGWQARWERVNTACQFDERADTGLGEAFDRMAYVHRNLPALKLKYQRMMKQFTEEHAEDVADMRRALDKSRSLLETHTEEPPREGQ